MAKKSKKDKPVDARKVEAALRARVVDLEKALDDATRAVKKARKDADKARDDADKAIRKTAKAAQKLITDSAEQARKELIRLTDAVAGEGAKLAGKAASSSSAAASAVGKATAPVGKAASAAKDVPAKAAAGSAPTTSYSDMTVVELRKAARTKGITNYSKMNKGALVSALKRT